MSWTTTQSEGVFTETSMLIGLSSGSRILRPQCPRDMGGVWERQIRSVRSILSVLMRKHGHTLDDESSRTLLTEVEYMINSRPLAAPSSDPEDLDPLTHQIT